MIINGYDFFYTLTNLKTAERTATSNSMMNSEYQKIGTCRSFIEVSWQDIRGGGGRGEERKLFDRKLGKGIFSLI